MIALHLLHAVVALVGLRAEWAAVRDRDADKARSAAYLAKVDAKTNTSAESVGQTLLVAFHLARIFVLRPMWALAVVRAFGAGMSGHRLVWGRRR